MKKLTPTGPAVFVVNRAHLLTGTALKYRDGDATLFDPKSGLSCILGLYLQSLGVPRTSLANETFVESLGDVPQGAQWLLDANGFSTDVTNKITEANDGHLHQVRRERKLAKLFAQEGIQVQFTGRYADATRAARLAYN